MQNLKRNLKDKKRNFSIVISIVTSILFLLFPIFTSPDFNWNFSFVSIKPFQQNFLSYLLALGFFFVHWRYLLPQLFFKKKYLQYFLSLIVAYIICILIIQLLFQNAPQMPSTAPKHFTQNRPAPFFPAQHTFQFLFALIVSLLLATYQRLQLIEQQKIEIELSYLKAQLEPHFLYNSLNSIYALVLKKSDAAPNAVVQLSNMMRYAFDENKSHFIELNKEFNFLEDFINMQSYRLHEHVKLNFNIERPTNLNWKIAPLILITFIENAFKYGVNPDELGNINIDIKVDTNGMLIFNCSNKIVTNTAIDESSKIGQSNTIKRLDSLYAGNYTINIKNEALQYQIFLKIQLHD